jgi:hypothetical protein
LLLPRRGTEPDAATAPLPAAPPLHAHVQVTASSAPPFAHRTLGHSALQEHVSRLKPLRPHSASIRATSPSSTLQTSQPRPAHSPGQSHAQVLALNTAPCAQGVGSQVAQWSAALQGAGQSQAHAAAFQTPPCAQS